MFHLFEEANGLCSLSGILFHRGASGTYFSKRHIPKLSMYPKALFYFPTKEDDASTTLGNVYQRDLSLRLLSI
jgi:hypothetical protein